MCDKYYKIGDFARMTGFSTSTLRDYERRGILIPHHKSPYGYRYYSEDQYQQFVKGVLIKPQGNNDVESG